jgi:hypothetical protein
MLASPNVELWYLDCPTPMSQDSCFSVGGLMHISRWFLGLILLGLSSTAALADPIDPKIVLGPTGSTIFPNQTDCAPSNTGSCFLPVDSTGFGIADVLNNLGGTIVSDTVTIPFLASFNRDSTPPVLSCATNPETAPGWTGTAVGNSCVFTGGTIANNVRYGLNFFGFCPAPACSTDAQHPTIVQFDLTAVAVPAPEPGTITLLGIGLAAVAAGRKRLKGTSTSSSGVC